MDNSKQYLYLLLNLCNIYQFYFIHTRFLNNFNSMKFRYGLFNFTFFKICCYQLVFVSILNVCLPFPSHIQLLILMSYAVINTFCFSFWHHDIYLSTILFSLFYLWYIFPYLIIFDMPLFKFLILLQVSFVYIFTVIHKFNFHFISSKLLLGKILNKSIRNFFQSMNIYFFNIFIILTETFLGSIILFHDSKYFYIYIFIGLLFHCSTFLFTRLGRTYHLILPSCYILIVPNQFQTNYLLVLFIPFAIYFLLISKLKHKISSYI